MGKSFFTYTERTSAPRRKSAWEILSHNVVPDYTVDLSARILFPENELNKKASVLTEKYQIIQQRIFEFKKK